MTGVTNVNPIVNVFKGDTFEAKRSEYFANAPSKIANLEKRLSSSEAGGPFFFGDKPL